MTETSARTCTVENVSIGDSHPLAVIAGPCVLESKELGLEVGRVLKATCDEAGLSYVFKASFDKANRSSIASARGPGLERGVGWLREIGETLGCPVTTDIHTPEQAAPVAEAIHLLQIPAFLCRQTDLLVAAGEAAKAKGRAVNVKKGQFMAPREMTGVVRKLHEAGCENVLLTERGTFFGYHRLVNDFVGLGDLMELDCSKFTNAGSPPVCFDVTHSTQLPGSGEQTGGRPDRAPLLARAAVAAGVHAVFIEAHPEPAKAMSDGATQLPTEVATDVLRSIARIRGAMA
ncbi:MAG: 3-deoxy-8-phosphooctulonate synthase [Phycisphaerae bacterium]|nr:3-deoxy-8-phosphooctulonate synthase [Phycisphaerae bacterium]